MHRISRYSLLAGRWSLPQFSKMRQGGFTFILHRLQRLLDVVAQSVLVRIGEV